MVKAFSYCVIMTIFSASILSCGNDKKPLPKPKADSHGKKYFTTVAEFKEWNDKSETIFRNREIGKFNYNVKLLSSDLLALQELQGEKYSNSVFESTKKQYEELIYLKFNISHDEYNKELLKLPSEYNESYSDRVKYASFHLNKDIIIINDSNDTIPCALHQFERAFNIQSGLNFLIAFPKFNFENGFTMIYQDNLFRNGIVKFRYEKENVELPYLKVI